MIFNDEVLFIHVPKTAGMSLSKFLLNALPGDVYCSVPKGQEGDMPAHVHVIEGVRHENLLQAARIVRGMGRTLDQFRLIISCMRIPYAMEVSRFHYLRHGHPWDKGKAQKLAMTGDFTAFARDAPFLGRWPSQIETFYTFNGQYLRNQVIIEQEKLEKQLRKVLDGYVTKPVKLPKENRSGHKGYKAYMTPEAEQGIYEKFRWVFDEGFYERMDFGRRAVK